MHSACRTWGSRVSPTGKPRVCYAACRGGDAGPQRAARATARILRERRPDQGARRAVPPAHARAVSRRGGRIVSRGGLLLIDEVARRARPDPRGSATAAGHPRDPRAAAADAVMNAIEVARRIGEAFDDDTIPYAIGGALALGVWGAPRATKDVDVTVFAPRTQIQRVFDSLERAGAMVSREQAERDVDRIGLFKGLLGR